MSTSRRLRSPQLRIAAFPAALPFALLTAFALAACADSSAEDASVDPRLAERSLAEPPDLHVGEWWTVEVDPILVGATFETTLVVTDRADGSARIGIPADDFRDDFLVLHVPVLGDVDLATMSWRVMWDDFEGLRFPLEEGRTWTADFHGRDVEARVTSIEGSVARITMTGEGERIELTYDAGMGMITELREEALGLGFRVTGHGLDYEGTVQQRSGIELGLMQGGPSASAAHHEDAPTPAAGEAGTSTETIEVTSPGSHGSLSFVVWNVGFEGEAGSYHIRATAPDGTVFEHQFDVEPGAPGVLVESFGHDAVQGTWQLDFHRGGPAGLLVELFTYDQVDVTLPAGQ
jgi:hypothetical protein